MNVTTRDLARIAASVVRDPIARVSYDAQRNASRPVRAVLHAAMTVGLAVACTVLALQCSKERAIRRHTETKLTEVITAYLPISRADGQLTSWPFTRPRVHAAEAEVARTDALPVTGSPDAKATVGSRAADFRQQLRKQLSDPAMRSALRGQQRAAVLQLYGDLLRSWHLPAAKSDRVLDFLAEQQLQEMDRSFASSAASGRGLPAPSSGAHGDAQSSDNSDELSALLTDPQRAQLSRQQATLSESLTVNALSDELSLAQIPMTDSQRDQLIQIMYDERTAIPEPDVQNSSADSADARRALEEWESALEQRVQDRAATVLTSAQQARYEQFMTRQRDARKAFAAFELPPAGDNSGAAVAPPAPSSP